MGSIMQKYPPHMLGKIDLESLINNNLLIRFTVVILYIPLDYSLRFSSRYLSLYSVHRSILLKLKPDSWSFIYKNKYYIICKITKHISVDLDK